MARKDDVPSTCDICGAARTLAQRVSYPGVPLPDGTTRAAWVCAKGCKRCARCGATENLLPVTEVRFVDAAGRTVSPPNGTRIERAAGWECIAGPCRAGAKRREGRSTK